MKFSLHDSLKVVLPHLHPEFGHPMALNLLEQLAQQLPPISRVLLECRLKNPSVRAIDLSQCILPEDRQILLRYLADQVDFSPEWQYILDLVQVWANGDGIASQIANLWLEFDLEAQTGFVPSVFVRFSEEGINDFGAAQEVLALLNCFFDNEALEHCFERLPEGAQITHVGAMLSRQGQSVRLNIAGLGYSQLHHYLHEIGWQGDLEGLETSVAKLYQYEAKPILTFDVGERVQTRLGFECVPSDLFTLDERWGSLLDYVVSQGWSKHQLVDVLQQWIGYDDPSNAKTDWPLSLILSALGQGQSIAALLRKVNHLKIVLEEDGSVEAKVYLWYGYETVPLADLGVV